MIIKKNKKKSILILIACLTLLTGAVAAYFLFFNKSDQTPSNINHVDYNKPTKDQTAAGNTTKNNSLNTTANSKPNISGSDQASPPVPQASGKGKVDATLTAANQNGSTLQLRFSIGAVTNSGTCTLTLKKDSSVITKTAEIQALAGSSTCKGFDVPTTELAPGTWQIGMHFENDNLVADTSGSTVVR